MKSMIVTSVRSFHGQSELFQIQLESAGCGAHDQCTLVARERRP